jgi:hypothetical protein
MPVYLKEDMVGADPDIVGFPHVLLCMAVVCTTGSDLYGVHIGDISTTDPTVDLFKSWLAGRNVAGGDIRAVYASANFPIRYQDHSGPGSDLTMLWTTEMNGIAKGLGYKGPFCGFDTSVIAPKDGTYIEFWNDALHSACRIFYKVHDRMVYENRTVKLGSTNISRINLFRKKMEIVTQVEAPATPIPDSILNEVDYSNRLLKNFAK